MKQLLNQWWLSRSPQERRVIAAVGLCLAVVVYAWFLQTTMQARQRLLPVVTRLQAQALQQSAQVDEIARLRAMPAATASTTDLRQLVQRQAEASGLTKSLVSVELVDSRHVKLVFGSVTFADWLAWADIMHAQHLRFATVRIEAQSAPGQVSVTTTLERPGR